MKSLLFVFGRFGFPLLPDFFHPHKELFAGNGLASLKKLLPDFFGVAVGERG
ncbi:MAG: hypothetical protein HC880_08335 [Bacteroidia bacterium]|nr:hypothetical protein [Bacteroidia bacterium]